MERHCHIVGDASLKIFSWNGSGKVYQQVSLFAVQPSYQTSDQGGKKAGYE